MVEHCAHCGGTPARQKHTNHDGVTVSYQQEDGLDEVFARNATVHLERMDVGAYLLIVNDTHVWLVTNNQSRTPIKGGSWVNSPLSEVAALRDAAKAAS